jgi:hypothetical protein
MNKRKTCYQDKMWNVNNFKLICYIVGKKSFDLNEIENFSVSDKVIVVAGIWDFNVIGNKNSHIRILENIQIISMVMIWPGEIWKLR